MVLNDAPNKFISTMYEDKADNLKEQVKPFLIDHDNPKPIESKKRKHISTWIGAFKASDKATRVSANFNSDISPAD